MTSYEANTGFPIPAPITDDEPGHRPGLVTAGEQAATRFLESLQDDGVDMANVQVDGNIVYAEGVPIYDGDTDTVL